MSIVVVPLTIVAALGATLHGHVDTLSNTAVCAATDFANNTFIKNCDFVEGFNTTDSANCCSKCAASSNCYVWVYTATPQQGKALCKLCSQDGDHVFEVGAVSGGRLPFPPAPRPTPYPAPAPVPPPPSSFAPNIIVLLTDDQDLVLGSMAAMPYTRKTLVGTDGAINFTNFRVNTPVCCPSRATLLAGRYNHNNKATSYARSGGGVVNDGMCMRMNTSQTLNPGFWQNSFVHRLKTDFGYQTGMFGKVLNDMTDYGCNGVTSTPGLDRMFVMCKHVYYNETWIDTVDGQIRPVNNTGDRPDEYTTSLIGNATLNWLKSFIDETPRQGAEYTRKPFFAWIGPHAPHLPSTPAPWYLDHPVGKTPVVKQPNYGVRGNAKHAFYPIEPVISAEDELAIEEENSKRLRSLLSVDDIVRALREFLVNAGEWNNTYLFFASDHGYSLGGFRVDSHKVYDHNTRIPLLVHTPCRQSCMEPGGKQPSFPASMVDLAPTILELAATKNATTSKEAASRATTLSEMDGISFAKQLHNETAWVDWPRNSVLVEYQSLLGGPHSNTLSCADWIDGYGLLGTCPGPFIEPHLMAVEKHISDSPNNSFSALRVMNDASGVTGGLLYAEFVDVSDPSSWFFDPSTINFYELYNMTADPFALDNIYDQVPLSLKIALHNQLHRAIACRGASNCTEAMKFPLKQTMH